MPALNHDGVWTGGYQAIVGYLYSETLCNDLDESLDEVQFADTVAYGAYLAGQAAPLIDLSLYVSAANWAATTRPAYSSLLSFPLTWTVPTLIRAEAIKRVEHLGLADLDRDFDPNGGLHLTAGRDALPEAFRRHLPGATKKTVHEEMTPEEAAAIRLFGLTQECLSVLEELLSKVKRGRDGKRPLRFYAGTPISSLDCLAFGYLALMLKPDVPRGFLRAWLEKKTPRLTAFVNDMMNVCITGRGDLPWAPAPRRIFGYSSRLFGSVMRSLPGVGDQYATEMRQRVERGSKVLDPRFAALAIGFVVTGLAAGYGFQSYRALQPFGALTQTFRKGDPRLNEFGALGTMLSNALNGFQPAPSGSVSATGSGGKAATSRFFARKVSEVD